ncbi:MAG: hypothetical protein JSU87_15420 [Gemmatimonadota bacterium]|nr:MAG: hypothetical protein JSU87_15420 [Gemmatimonadota bacterium]
MRSTYRLRTEDGFGLPTAILGVIVFSALALLGIALTQQELRTQVRTTSRSIAFYAAETGLAQALENWNRPDVLDMGESWVVDQGTLPTRSAYRVVATSLDDGTTVQPIYAIQAEGRAPNGAIQHTGILTTGVPFGSPVRAALKAQGQVRVVGRAEVDGWDSIPAPWMSSCPPPGSPFPGALMSDTSKVAHVGAATIEGSPPVDEQADTTGWFDFGPFTYEQIVDIADHTFGGSVNMSSGPAPTLNADGSCNTADAYNWGDPDNPGQPCHRWFPIVHVQGDLTTSGAGSGQGIILVDGNMSMCGGFTFHGIIVARGSVKSCGNGFKVYGGVVAGESELTGTGGFVAGSNTIQYSACAIDRVLSRSKAARPEPVTERPWFQIR